MRILAGAVCVVMLLVMTGDVYAGGTTEERDPVFRDRFGIKAGYVTGGFVSEGITYDLKYDYEVTVFFDFNIYKHFLLTPSVDVIGVEPDVEWVKENRSALHPGISVKYILANSSRSLAFRPGAGLGYGLVRKRYTHEDSRYLTISFFGELVYYVHAKYGLLFEVNHFTTSGQDDTYDLQSDGIWFFRVGFLL